MHLSTNAEASLEVTNNFNAGRAQLIINFQQGEEYTISCEAYATQAKTLDIIVIQNVDPFPEYFREKINITTEKEVYEFTFLINGMSIGDGAFLLEFAGGFATVFVWKK